MPKKHSRQDLIIRQWAISGFVLIPLFRFVRLILIGFFCFYFYQIKEWQTAFHALNPTNEDLPTLTSPTANQTSSNYFNTVCFSVIVKEFFTKGFKKLKNELNDDIESRVRQVLSEYQVTKKPPVATSKDKGSASSRKRKNHTEDGEANPSIAPIPHKLDGSPLISEK